MDNYPESRQNRHEQGAGDTPVQLPMHDITPDMLKAKEQATMVTLEQCRQDMYKDYFKALAGQDKGG